jgi:preprotein translocase subunit SecB
MAEENAEAGQAGAAEAEGPQLRVLTQYTKDLSFENPNSPRLLGGGDTPPAIEVQINVNVQRLSESDYEVVLAIKAEAKLKEEVMFLAELEYAGLFRLMGIPDDQLEAVLLIECPRQIFPFARRIVADATRDGGFPPLMVDPIDFVGLYQARKAQGEAQTARPN